MVEKFENMNMKDVILENWKNKISFPFNYKDLEELEEMIDYYEGENKELKKQLEAKRNITMFVDTNETQEELDEKMGNDMYQNYLEKEKQKLQEQLSSNTLQFENQQKEFIKYLEDKLAIINNVLDTEKDEDKVYFTLIRKDVVEETLLKYKEIIGDKDE